MTGRRWRPHLNEVRVCVPECVSLGTRREDGLFPRFLDWPTSIQHRSLLTFEACTPPEPSFGGMTVSASPLPPCCPH